MRLIKKISLVLSFAALLLPTVVFAVTQNPDEKSGNYNMILISLVCLMLVLLFVIGMLANTMRQLSFVIRDKMRKERNEGAGLVKSVLLMILFCASAINSFAADAEKTVVAATPESNFISGIPKDDFYAIMSVIALELVVIFALVLYTRVFLKIIINKPELVPAAKAIVKKSWFWDKFNAAATIEQEKDILLDHNYDGIQELDNSLPPWWKYGFYLTILVACIYLYRFHISHDGLSQKEEYAADMQKGEEEKAAYLAQSANNVDENTVVLLTDGTSVTEGHEIFTKNCTPCHLADGGGSVGPNLTDEYWLHGGGIKDIFKSIKYGWQDKGMKSWKDDLSPKQIQEVASFIKSLKGTHPAVPKAPQGGLYIEAAQGKVVDSAKAKADTAAKVLAMAKVNMK